jgi:hypothetical protein
MPLQGVSGYRYAALHGEWTRQRLAVALQRFALRIIWRKSLGVKWRKR